LIYEYKGKQYPAVYEYRGKQYPDYLKRGNACRFVVPFAQMFCRGLGYDVGAGRWPLPITGAIPVDLDRGGDAMALPDMQVNYVFSSHCLEHLPDYVGALEHWKTRIIKGGCLFLYLPHPDMEYWLPQNNRKHLHVFEPYQIENCLIDLGFEDVLVSERDLAWSFAAVGFVR